MDRITFEGNFCDIAMCRESPCPYNGMCSQRETWERLKKYEDSGLDPQDIISAVDMAKIAYALHELNAYKDIGPIDHIRDIIQAEQDGRMVVLPCKVDDDVWFVRKFGKERCIKRAEVSCINIDCRGKVFVSARRISGGYIGKTVFLTREEADAALKGGEV